MIIPTHSSERIFNLIRYTGMFIYGSSFFVQMIFDLMRYTSQSDVNKFIINVSMYIHIYILFYI